MKTKNIFLSFVFILSLLIKPGISFTQNDFWVQTGGSPGVEILALTINSDGHIFAGTYDGGIFRSTDNGENWQQINNGLTVLRVWSFVINSTGDIFAGTSESKIFRSTDNGANWNEAFVDQDFFAAVEDLAVNSEGNIFAGYLGVLRSSDNGQNWQAINMGLQDLLVNAIALNSNDHIFIGTSDTAGVFRSLDNGENWTNVSNGLPNACVFSLGIKSNGNIYAGTIDGEVFLSIDNGDKWAKIKDVSHGSIHAIAINSSQQIFLGTGGEGVFRSTDDGENWTQINSGLTGNDWFVNALTIDTTGILFVGTFEGNIFHSREITTSVSELHDSIPHSFRLEQNYPNPFNPSTTIQFSLPEKSLVSLRIFNISGQEVISLVSEKLTAGQYQIDWDASGQASGVYYYQLQTEEFLQTKKLLLLK